MKILNKRLMLLASVLSVIGFGNLSNAEESLPQISTPQMDKSTKSLNLIFFGNSFTFGAGNNAITKDLNGIPGLVQRLAKSAGYNAPNVQKSTEGGKTLEWHFTHKIQTIKKPDQLEKSFENCKWDYVVLQDYSTRPTSIKTQSSASAQPEKTILFAEKLFSKVKESNSEAKAIMYLTWARHLNKKGFYPTPYKDPKELQADLTLNYKKCADSLNEKFGKETVRIAPCGAAWGALNFPKELYAKDLYHASGEGSLLNAMIIFRTIYGGTVSNLDIKDLSKLIGISDERTKQLAELADSM